MHRFFLFAACATVLFLNADNAFAQFTTRQSSAVQRGSSNSGSANGSLRFTRSSSSSGARTSQGAVRSAKQQSTASTSYTKGGKTNSASKSGASVSSEEDDLDLPNFSITVPEETKGMSQSQKIILLEEFARKKQAEKEAKAKAEAARKAEIARKIAEEEPAPGMVFDENGMERPIPKGEVWIYPSEFKQGELRGRVNCSWKMVLQNRTNANIESLEVGVSWPSYALSMSFQNIAPNASKTEEMFMFSPNCPSLRAKPRIQPSNCVIGPIKGEACNQYVILK